MNGRHTAVDIMEDVMTNAPTPEAIVKAALERAADVDVKYPSNESLEYQNGWDHAGLAIQEAILALTSDQAEVAQIIQNAGGQTDPYLYAVGFEDGFKEAQGRVKELEAINVRLKELLNGFYASEDIEDLLSGWMIWWKLKGDSDE